MSRAHGRIVPVLLSGGTGPRQWRLSRETYPKQLLTLLDDKTLLQQTALRVSDPGLFTEPIVVANAEHRFVIGEQLRAVGIHRQSRRQAVPAEALPPRRAIGWWSMEPRLSRVMTRRSCCARTNRCSCRWAACTAWKIREKSRSI